MAVKIVRILTDNDFLLEKLIEIAPEIGKSITTPSKLEAVLLGKDDKIKQNVSHITKTVQDENGKKLFSFKVDHKGVPSIVFNKDLLHEINFDEMCEKLQLLVLKTIKSGRPDLILEI